MSGDRTGDLVALDDAMNALARLDPRKVQIIEMRFFGGLSVEETAEVLKVFANRNGWADRVTCIRAFIGGRTEVQARIEDMPDYAGALSIAQEQLISRLRAYAHRFSTRPGGNDSCRSGPSDN